MPVTVIFSGKTQKESENISNCQDAFAINEDKGCFAIADGASQSFYPNIWAEYLVDEFCNYNPDINENNWQSWLIPCQEDWLKQVKERVVKAQQDKSPVWVTNQNRLNFKQSATSTFIGLQFLENEVKITIVGDSCLFIFSGEKLLKTYPLKSSQEFDDRPEYFASYSKDNSFSPRFISIPLENNKSLDKIYFILATDALSEYIFQCLENNKNILESLLDITCQKDFENFVSSARNSQTLKMKNDDVTLVVLALMDKKINSYLLPSVNEIIRRKQEPLNSDNSPKNPILNEENSKENSSEIDTIIIIEEEEPRQKKNLITQLNDFILSLQLKFKNHINNNDSLNDPRKLKISNQRLKKQRLALSIVTLFLLVTSLFLISSEKNKNKILTAKIKNKNNELNKIKLDNNKIIKTQKIIPLKKGTTIYQDKNFSTILINSLDNAANVVVIEDEKNFIKFKVDLYTHQSTLNDCETCQSNQIEIIKNENIRLLPFISDVSLFGELNDNFSFKKVAFNEIPDWYKFEFEGYIKK